MPSYPYFWWCHRCLLGDEAEATETKQPVAQDTAEARGYYQSPTKWTKITPGRIMSVWCQSVLSWQELSFLKWQLPYNFWYLNHFHNGQVLTDIVLSPSVVSDSVTPWTVAHQAPLYMGFSRQECWSGLPCHPPGDGIRKYSFISAPKAVSNIFSESPKRRGTISQECIWGGWG